MITNQSTTTPNLFTPVGSAEYMAPEVVDIFRGDTFSYDKKCDLWSLGVLLYMMLSGSPPFNAKCLKDCGWERGMNCEDCQVMLMKKITAGDYTFPQEIWGKISSEAKDLISKLLEINAERRLSANETLRHAWLNEAAVIPDTPLTTPKVLKRYSSIPEELSLYAASCLKCNRQVSEREQINGRFFALSPPGNSNLAIRRERKDTPPIN
jgi:MAP kinase interacting serine/threonine kinase